MLDLPQIREKMQGRNIRDISRATGIHHNVVYRMAWGTIGNPSYKTIKAVSDYFLAEDQS